MTEHESRCEVDGCEAPATTRYLDASRPVAAHFFICDRHAARLLHGSGAVVRDVRDGASPVLVIP